jgi:hypothetical protein
LKPFFEPYLKPLRKIATVLVGVVDKLKVFLGLQTIESAAVMPEVLDERKADVIIGDSLINLETLSPTANLNYGYNDTLFWKTFVNITGRANDAQLLMIQ